MISTVSTVPTTRQIGAPGAHHNKIHGLTINNVGAGGLSVEQVYDCYNIVYGLQVAGAKSYQVLLGTGTIGNVIYGNIGDARDTLRVQDLGTGNVICSTNSDSGNMACTQSTGIPTAGTFPTNNMLSTSRIDNTHIAVNMRGSDGTVRYVSVPISSTGASLPDVTTGQVVLRTGNTVTLSATAPSASRILTFVDPGADANFVTSEGSATINGAKTFSSVVASSVGFSPPSTGGGPDATALDFSAYNRSTINVIGACPTTPVLFKFARVGKQVSIAIGDMPLQTLTSTDNMRTQGTIPPWACPTDYDTFQVFRVITNNAGSHIPLRVGTNCTITWFGNANDGPFGSGATLVGWKPFSIAYPV
jgi:hypothetical protein